MKSPEPVTRRAALLGSAVLGTAAVLAACGPSQPVDASTGEPTASGGPSATAGQGAASGPALTGGLSGVEWTVTAGPAVVTEGTTLVHLTLFPTQGEAILGTTTFSTYNTPGDFIGGIRMLDLAGAACYPESGGSTEGVLSTVSADEPLVLHPLFTALAEGTEEVALFLPGFGVIPGIPVESSTDVFDAAAVLAASSPDLDDAGPYPLQTLIGAADGSSETQEDEDTTTVLVSGDVTFASDSAELTAEADTILSTVTAQIERYPSGGSLAVTGHTDDVDSDAHNQELSERRVQAVGDRLGRLTDLSAWQVTLTGKGESEPRVPNDSDANRAVNRRVEVVLTPAEPAEGEDGLAQAAAGELPEPAGPVGTGKDGVDVDYKGATLHVSLDQVTRADGCLIGRVRISADATVYFSPDAFHLPHAWQAHWGVVTPNVCSLSLLDGATRYLPLQAEDDALLTPMTDVSAPLIDGPDAPVLLPAVWPDTGQDEVVLDLPGDGDDAIALRLTGIPVIEA
ncbi:MULTISPECIES: OmpA family protein [unclassified Actinomyces]|uniref:OmpA family protein n=1 Tax=unclassified Actinomyces TaxID=2609248 RepID=UPI002017E9F2|nr:MULTISPECIES: OmpA family protein [unclassified Actinomyces]MCL3777070.1 OmpA family protein [Actinomyces sp. AC-20-1]MCL3790290.1 OmpA family protein [Actinomyces sp. 187325]MCL3791291.1 OmpA family protein [Actinomyces sp. 186855]MCL3793794.1 OmpA family protein [Actinomyces sp. 217892]